MDQQTPILLPEDEHGQPSLAHTDRTDQYLDRSTQRLTHHSTPLPAQPNTTQASSSSQQEIEQGILKKILGGVFTWLSEQFHQWATSLSSTEKPAQSSGNGAQPQPTTQHRHSPKGKKRPEWLILPLILAIVSGATGYFIHDPTPAQPITIIHGIAITQAYIKQDASYWAYPLFAPSYFYCDGEYQSGGKTIEAQFVDKDEGAKTNSGAIYQQCSNDITSKKTVTLVLSGIRDTSRSLYPNILVYSPDQ